MVKLLLEHGASHQIVYEDKNKHIKQTPLFIAIANGHQETALVLINKGANSARLCTYPNSPLFHSPFDLAMEQNQHTLVKAMLDTHKRYGHRLYRPRVNDNESKQYAVDKLFLEGLEAEMEKLLMKHQCPHRITILLFDWYVRNQPKIAQKITANQIRSRINEADAETFSIEKLDIIINECTREATESEKDSFNIVMRILQPAFDTHLVQTHQFKT